MRVDSEPKGTKFTFSLQVALPDHSRDGTAIHTHDHLGNDEVDDFVTSMSGSCMAPKAAEAADAPSTPPPSQGLPNERQSHFQDLTTAVLRTTADVLELGMDVRFPSSFGGGLGSELWAVRGEEAPRRAEEQFRVLVVEVCSSTFISFSPYVAPDEYFTSTSRRTIMSTGKLLQSD